MSFVINNSSDIEIETERLRLVPFSLEMVRAALQNKTELARLLGATVPPEWPNSDFDEILPMILQSREENLAQAEWDRLIIHKAEGTLIGDLGLKGGPNQAGTADLGYGIVPGYQRQGYAYEAAQALVNWAFKEKGVKCITADCLDNNFGSIRVLEKLGMRRLKHEDKLFYWELLAKAKI